MLMKLNADSSTRAEVMTCIMFLIVIRYSRQKEPFWYAQGKF